MNKSRCLTNIEYIERVEHDAEAAALIYKLEEKDLIKSEENLSQYTSGYTSK